MASRNGNPLFVAPAILVVLLCAIVHQIEAFSSSHVSLLPPAEKESCAIRSKHACFRDYSRSTALYAATEDDDDDDDDDDYNDIDSSNLGDWRKFRASLIDGGLPSESSPSAESSTPPKKKSVAVENEALLERQSKELAQEYKSGVWAHTIGQPEVGGLLCRMPIEAELYYHGEGYWKEKLQIMLSLNDDEDKDISRMDEDPGLLSTTKVNHWFQTADRMITRELQSITTSDKIKNGVLDPNDLDENERVLMDKYMDYKQTWQEICLLLSDNPETGCSEAVIINRPITKNINKQLAKIMLEGSTGSSVGNFAFEFSDRVVQAFGQEAAVYMGGPDMQDQPALLIHGIKDLEGSFEVAPGTGIYRGGWEAAVEGVIEGKYKPLDFRFFLGRQSYNPKENPRRGVLLQKVQEGKYQPVACARTLALKQCLGLPKPLWHEVLELCGGDMKSLSGIELKKRTDLQQ